MAEEADTSKGAEAAEDFRGIQVLEFNITDRNFKTRVEF